jgi:CRISPR/Cas system-associated exonuclease Cas4 (RecB family)
VSIELWLGWSAVAAIGVFVAAFALLRRSLAAAGDAERRSRPAALAGATLRYMEKTFRTRAPTPLVALIDRAYRDTGGELVLVELKTRWSKRAYATDVIQLSVQKLALEGQTGQKVAAHGFVTVKMPRGTAAPRSYRVELMDSTQIAALYRRREDVIAGRVAPRYADSSRACKGCAFRDRCDWPATGHFQRHRARLRRQRSRHATRWSRLR